MVEWMVPIPLNKSIQACCLCLESFHFPPLVLVESGQLVKFAETVRVRHAIGLRAQEEILLVECKGVLGVPEDRRLRLLILEAKSVILFGSLGSLLLMDIIHSLFSNKASRFLDLRQGAHWPLLKGHSPCQLESALALLHTS